MLDAAQLAMVSGPMVGGALTEYTTWRWCLYINLPLGGVAALCLAVIRFPDHTDKEPARRVLASIHHHLDLLGFAWLVPAVTQLLLALQYGGVQFPRNSPVVIDLFCGSAATFAVWLVRDRFWGGNATAPLVPMHISEKRIVWASAGTQIGLSAALLCTSCFLSIYFQAVMGASPLASSVYLLPSILSQLFGAILSGFLVKTTGCVLPYAIFSTALACAGTGVFSLVLSPTTSTGMWVGAQVLAGVGHGIGLQMVQSPLRI